MHLSHQCKSTTWASIHRELLIAGAIFILAHLSGCGGSSMQMTASGTGTGATAQSCSTSTCGPAMVTLTDAAGDFLTYQIGLVSLQLKKADGTLVETLPASSRT